MSVCEPLLAFRHFSLTLRLKHQLFTFKIYIDRKIDRYQQDVLIHKDTQETGNRRLNKVGGRLSLVSS